MIKIGIPRDRDKFCLNCNCHKEDCKELKFSIGSNNSCFTVICLCKDCRDQLKNLLSQEKE